MAGSGPSSPSKTNTQMSPFLVFADWTKFVQPVVTVAHLSWPAISRTCARAPQTGLETSQGLLMCMGQRITRDIEGARRIGCRQCIWVPRSRVPWYCHGALFPTGSSGFLARRWASSSWLMLIVNVRPFLTAACTKSLEIVEALQCSSLMQLLRTWPWSDIWYVIFERKYNCIVKCLCLAKMVSACVPFVDYFRELR